MRFIADENCDRILVTELRAAGFDVVWIRETAPGMSDTEVMEAAAAQDRVVVTSDQGFGAVAERAVASPPPAVVLMRLERLLPATRASVAIQAIKNAGESLLRHVTVIEPHQVRRRPYKD